MKKVSWITSFISILLIAGYAAFLAWMWKSIPDTVATHFDAHGVADGFGNKTFLLVLTAVVIAGGLAASFLAR